ncbi:HD family phosphohydrolase [Anaeromyxobacter oryzae]|uniref:HD family phosphohydrolase n=1 Tax=Anaeromyxobacter oryzae TaxID=2918170 RepID=UPI0020C10E42|nr:HDIG domain-containing metalloprotein [Anaeromyxobacter oryzae]
MSGPSDSPPPPPPPEAAPAPHVDWPGRVLRIALVAAVAAACGWLLAPGAVHRLPGPEALGTPAPATIKADRDYDIVDEEATARRRADEAASVRPVYDLEDGAADEAVARIHAAFDLMRDEEQAFRQAGRDVRDARDVSELDRRYTAQRAGFVSRLQVVVRDEDLAALAAARFSEDVERELAALAQRGLSGMIVEDLKLLPADREQGFAVRTFRSGALQGERVLADRALVRDVATARDEVVRTAAARLERAPAPLRAAVVRLATAMVRPTLSHDQAETERRRADAAARVKPVGIPVKRGEKIIGDGERVEKRHLVVFDGIRAQRKGEDLAHLRLGGGLLVALAVAVLWRFARRNVPRFRPARRDALLLAVVLVATLGMGAIGLTIADALHERVPSLPPPALSYLVPFAAGAMIVRQVLSAEAALLLAIASGLTAGLLAGQSIGFALFATLGSVAAAGVIQGGRDRTSFFRAGLAVGAVGAAVVAALGLYAGRGALEIGTAAVAALLGGAVLLPVVVVGSLPLVEGVFGYVTDVKLLELANLNHPALKELIVQAPGTYHHSILMGSLVEAGAQAIGANPLLARVCAYYHDLGKIRNPLYFAENQRGGENRHDTLAPSMSALIVKRHVTDGLELARHWRLPRPVQDAIPQHHGTRLVAYFWAKAQQRASDEGGRAAVLDEGLFRYPGPKPQTREAALVMIADACEASSRALIDPTGGAIRGLVAKRINEIFSEGQLDECELTLRDLNAIAAAMVRALEAIYHTRPEYPGRPRDDAQRPTVQLVAKP